MSSCLPMKMVVFVYVLCVLVSYSLNLLEDEQRLGLGVFDYAKIEYDFLLLSLVFMMKT